MEELKPRNEVEDRDDDDRFSPSLIHPISESSEEKTDLSWQRRLIIFDVTKLDVQHRKKMQLRTMHRGLILPLDIKFAELEKYLQELGMLDENPIINQFL